MKNKREIQKEKFEQKWNLWCSSEKGLSSLKFDVVQHCLDGTATEAEYCSLDAAYASIGPDGFKYVSPSSGPLTITGDSALKIWSCLNHW